MKQQPIKTIEKKLIIFLDVGDTIIDEGTEIRNDEDVVINADIIPGADEMVKTLYNKGYSLVVVADGLAQSFKNTLTQNKLYDYFTAMIYSENIKQSKPSPRMFKAAIGALDLSESDVSRIVMVGNNLKRDVVGANRIGITSIHLNWTPRYPTVPENEEETPDYVINKPIDLIKLVDQINEGMITNNS